MELCIIQQDKRAIRPPCIFAGMLGSNIWTQWTHCMAFYGPPNVFQLIGCLFFGLPLLSLFSIQIYMNAGIPVQVDNSWNYPRRLMCIFLSVCACLYVLAAELRVRPGTKGKEQWPQYTSICPTLFCATVWARACTQTYTYICTKVHTHIKGTVYLIPQAELL